MLTRGRVPLRRTFTIGAAALLLAAPGASGQQLNNPHAAYAYPAGGRQGTTVQVQIGGRYLEGASGVVFSTRGLRADVVGYSKPLTAREINDLRDKAQDLQKEARTPERRRELLDIRDRISDSLRRNANPVLSELVTLSVTIDAAAEPGPLQMRLVTPLGLSDPVTFVVGQLPEVTEREAGSPSEPAAPSRRALNQPAGQAPAEVPESPGTAQPVSLPVVINGRIVPGEKGRTPGQLRQPGQYVPGDVDRYTFDARKGQNLVVAVNARDLMPYLADTVPGWFQPTVALFDMAGREVAYDDDYRSQPDPVLHYRVAADGPYTLEIKDALYRGREDFVYRLSIGELPFVTSVFPLGGAAHAKTAVHVTGWNLPAAALLVNASDAGPGTFPITMRRGAIVSNRVPFALDTVRDTLEQEPNDTEKDAQKLTVPVIVNGRIQAAGDVDVFALTGRAGEPVVAEVMARRLGSPVDSVLELTDASGRRLAKNDDQPDKGHGLIAHQADSRISCTLPSNGTYYLRVSDLQHKGGAECGYRLRVSAPEPDFELWVAPSGINARPGSSVPVTVHVLRKDGFSGDIELALKDAPEGLVLSGGTVPSGLDRIRLTLDVPPVQPAEPITLVVEGRATIRGKAVVRRAAAAEEMMQAFAYRHLVPADSLRLAVLGRGGARFLPRLLSAVPVRIPAGGTARMRVALPGVRAFEHVQLELSEPPEGVELRDVVVGQAVAEFTLLSDASKVTAGLRGNLIVTASGERPAQQPKNQDASGSASVVPAIPAAAARRRIQVAVLPAIAFEITR